MKTVSFENGKKSLRKLLWFNIEIPQNK